MNLVAFDFGKNGAISIGTDRDQIPTQVYLMPRTDTIEGLKRLAFVLKQSSPCIALGEEVFALPRSGAATALTFGKHVGSVVAVCAMLDIDLRCISAQTWTKEFGTKKDHKNEYAWKKHLLAKANEYYGGCCLTEATCDSVLLWRWFRANGHPPRRIIL